MTWTTKVSRKTTAAKEQIWKLWEDVPNWKAWDHGLESTELFGEFQTGTKGTLKPVGGPKLPFTITACKPLVSFSDLTRLPFCKLEFHHSLSEVNGERIVTHEAVFSGPLTFLFSRIIGSGIAKDLPTTVANLVALAESK